MTLKILVGPFSISFPPSHPPPKTNINYAHHKVNWKRTIPEAILPKSSPSLPFSFAFRHGITPPRICLGAPLPRHTISASPSTASTALLGAGRGRHSAQQAAVRADDRHVPERFYVCERTRRRQGVQYAVRRPGARRFGRALLGGCYVYAE